MHVHLDDLNNFQRRWEKVSEPVLQLHRAAASGSPADIKAIISTGTDVDVRDGSEMTPLMSAAYNERLDNIATLLEAGADISAKDFNDCTVLHFCCRNKSVDCTKALVAAGAEIEDENKLGHKPLHMACIYGTRELMEYYMGRCESIEETGVDGRTPLLVAAASGKLQNFEILMYFGADITAEDDDGCNLLHLAAKNKDSEILRHVLTLQLDFTVNSMNNQGNTPLHFAAYENNFENVKVLLNAGADISARTQDGETALYLAASENNLEAAKALLDAGADINCRNDDGYTPILTAASADRIELVKLFFEAGADTGIETNGGLDLITLAKESGGDKSLKYLKEMSALEQRADDADRSIAESIPEDLVVQANYTYGDQTRTIPINVDAFINWASPFADKSIPVKFGDLLDKLDVTMEMAEKNWMGLTGMMTKLGFGFAPHLILIDGIPDTSDPVYLYRTTENHYELDEDSEFRLCIFDLGIGSYILSLGRFNAKQMRSALREFAFSKKILNKNTMQGLQANADHLQYSPTVVGFFDGFFKSDPNKANRALRSSAVRFAKSLNVGKAKKAAVLEPFYEFLELDPKLAHSDLQSGVPKFGTPDLAKLTTTVADMLNDSA